MIIINQNIIKRNYKVCGYINFVFSFIIVILSDISFTEKLFSFLVYNILYHLGFYFFHNLAKDPIRFKNKFNKKISSILLKIFSLSGVLTYSIFLYYLISRILETEKYYEIFAILLPFGFLLGAISLWNQLKNE